MRLVFMGTPDFAVSSLAALLEAHHDVALVITQPDRPSGRGRTVRPPAVKRFAVERGLPVEQPEKLRDPTVLERLAAAAPDAIIVAAYGKILPRGVLDLPKRGAINVHGSLLPKYRGAAPIQRALLAGEALTGVTIMQMNERMDAGDILLQREIAIRPDDTAASLGARMSEVGAAALVEALDLLQRGELVARPQREEEATLAPMVRKEEGRIDWTKSAIEIERAIRAFDPWPGTYTSLGDRLLKIRRAAVVDGSKGGPPGAVVRADTDAVEVATGDGTLRLLGLQVEGKRSMPATEAVAGRLIRQGDCLGS